MRLLRILKSTPGSLFTPFYGLLKLPPRAAKQKTSVASNKKQKSITSALTLKYSLDRTGTWKHLK